MDERSVERAPVKAQVRYRSGTGLALQAEIVDLSRFGCQIRSISHSLRRGDQISIRIGEVGPVLGHVRWLHLGKQAGIEFDIPIHVAVFDHLIRSLSGESCEGISKSEFHKLRAKIRSAS